MAELPRTPFFGEMAGFFDERAESATFQERQRRFLEVGRMSLAHSPTDQPLCLDLGCGPGAITIALAGLGFETIGVDSSPAMIELATRAADPEGHCKFACADLVAFLTDFSRTADLIVSSSVFEYLDNPGKVVELVAARLRPGAIFAVSIPNRRSLYRWIEPALLLRRPTAVRYTREWRNNMRARQLIAVARHFGLEPMQTSYFGQIVLKSRPVLARFTHSALVGTMTLVVFAKR